ncbi:MAG: diguanylate cyclase [Oscillospiraceae bacterium]|nr:diguanylate cyclase [Oscillospiraceae bacterium]
MTWHKVSCPASRPLERCTHTRLIEGVIHIYKEQKQKRKQKILVADDSEMNRSILADMLEDEYEIIEAENGVEAVSILQKLGAEISLVLLDIVMPEMDGFGVLNVMNQRHWIEDIPVIMISAESAPAHVERAYEQGITDFISRPFDALIVHRRVINTILLYAKQKKLIGLVEDQIYEKERNSTLMVDILSHIVEFRNGESGMHVLHVRTLTEMVLQHLIQKTSQYQISPADISIISTASALHDIGKIAIPEDILNKPGKLTDEEFQIMKSHTTAGAKLLEDLPFHQSEPLIKITYQICRWHHERYDGRGYPDGLKGDEIPISAQVVALADVYDALTSVRCYKPAFTHEKAIEMILDGQCGTFNPLLMDCLREISDRIATELNDVNPVKSEEREMRSFTLDLLRHDELTASERTLRLLEHERMKYNFFAAMTQEIQFEYTCSPAMVTLSAWGAEKLGLPEIVMDPLEDKKVLEMFCDDGLTGLSEALRRSTPEKPVVTFNTQLKVNGEERWHRIVARATWSADEPPQFTGAIGKVLDVHDSRMKLDALERMASHDTLTGLLNHAYAKAAILKRLEETPTEHFALAILDLDYFKSANDTYGHMFGDSVLKYMADRLRHSVRSGDIVARVGGDEFLIFLECRTDALAVIDRIYKSLLGQYEDFTISISMGVARTELVGVDYEELFHAADQALYTVKRSGRGQYRFYDNTMNKMLSVISPIDGSEAETAETE